MGWLGPVRLALKAAEVCIRCERWLSAPAFTNTSGETREDAPMLQNQKELNRARLKSHKKHQGFRVEPEAAVFLPTYLQSRTAWGF